MHRGEPTIREKAITVRTIIERTRLGETAAQVVEAYPVLTLGQVHDALGYYYDHPEKIENYIRENAKQLQKSGRVRSESLTAPTIKRRSKVCCRRKEIGVRSRSYR